MRVGRVTRMLPGCYEETAVVEFRLDRRRRRRRYLAADDAVHATKRAHVH